MDEIQRENLKTLAAYLAKGNTAKQFNMDEFCVGPGDNPDYTEIVDLDRYSCGTVACAAGHGPAAGIPAHKHESWGPYVKRAFGVDQFGGDDAFGWMFGPSWAATDNTPQGAAARIEWFLEHGVPADSFEQRTGSAPLCYQASAPPSPAPTPAGWNEV